MNNGKFITDWVLDTVKEKYADDIALVVSHTTLRIDDKGQTVSYFIPITDKGRAFSQTFILEGEGFDLWGIEWERMEGFANLDEYNITCLADGEILYARTPEDRERFEQLRRWQAEKLQDPVIQRAHALEAFEQAKQIYLKMLFAGESDVKMCAGYVIDYLAWSICFSYGRYFRKSQTNQLAELTEFGKIPAGFSELYNGIIRQKNPDEQKKQCYDLIRIVEKFLECPDPAAQTEFNFQDLADWYAELSYTWLRIRHYSEIGDVALAYLWGTMLQQELNRVCEDFGIARLEVMCMFDPEDLAGFAVHTNALEVKIRQVITENGGKIREYLSREEFLNEV